LIHKRGENVQTVAHELAHHINYALKGPKGHSRQFATLLSDLLADSIGLL
jgi:predicted SprT family Zn-dependent metalloprotease